MFSAVPREVMTNSVNGDGFDMFYPRPLSVWSLVTGGPVRTVLDNN